MSRQLKRRRIPVYGIADYTEPNLAGTGIHVGRIEQSLSLRPNRVQFHRHDHFELFWLEGAGAFQADLVEHALRPKRKHFILVRPGLVHSWRGEVQGCMVAFTRAFLDVGESARAGAAAWLADDASPFLAASPALAAKIEPLLDLLADEFQARADGWVELAMHLVRSVLILAGREQMGRARAGTDRGGEIVARFRQSLETEFRCTTRVKDYARQLSISPGHLNALVREHFGRTAGEVIRERVVLEAQRLLRHSSLGVAEVAYQLGYDDPSYFARVFRKATSRTPAKFRSDSPEKYQTSAESCA